MPTSNTKSDEILVVVTIDTEPDNVWGDHLSKGLRNIDALLPLQDLFDRFGAKATILVTHEVAADPGAVRTIKMLKDDRGAEVGAHLHPWDNPPFMPSQFDRKYHTFPHELPEQVFRDKLSSLTELIAKNFGSPRSYRAGRYGFAASHVPVLEDLGYVVDTSVTPLCSWQGKSGAPSSEGGLRGIDYRIAPLDPYFLSYSDVTRPGDARLLEIPVTVYSTRALGELSLRFLARLPEKIQSIILRTTGIGLAWARPTGQFDGTAEQMLKARLGRRSSIVNIMFHSSELVQGGSPSTKTQQQVEQVFASLSGMLTFLAGDSRVNFTTLADAAARLVQSDRIAKSVPNAQATAAARANA